MRNAAAHPHSLARSPIDGPARRPARLSAFTITELLVVIAIIVLVIAIAVPAFSSILYSSERSIAENNLRVGITAGRDVAIQSDAGDGAAVFFFSSGKLTIVPCVAVVRSLDDRYISASGTPGNVTSVEREVFVPVPGVEPIQLPRGWGVRGFAPPGSVDGSSATPADENGWYESLATLGQQGNWVFPETAFYDPDNGDDGWKRQSFMIRFKAGTGTLDAGNRKTALVVDPIPTAGFRQNSPWANARVDLAADTAQFVKRTLAQPEFQLPLADKRRIVGDEAVDTVLVRPVTEIVLYDDRRMVASIGGSGLNRATASIYGDPAAPRDFPTSPTIDTTLFPGAGDETEVAKRISEWLEGRYEGPAGAVDSDARIFTLQRYLGQVQEVTP